MLDYFLSSDLVESFHFALNVALYQLQKVKEINHILPDGIRDAAETRIFPYFKLEIGSRLICSMQ